MKNARLFQLTALLALLTLALAAPATALPRPCIDVCHCEASCILRCSVGISVTSCGAMGMCSGNCLAAGAPSPKASAALLDEIFTRPEAGAATPAPAADVARIQ